MSVCFTTLIKEYLPKKNLLRAAYSLLSGLQYHFQDYQNLIIWLTQYR